MNGRGNGLKAATAVAVLAAVVILCAGCGAASTAEDVATANESGVTCIYRGLPFSPKKVGCAPGGSYRRGSDFCNSDITGNDDFMLLREGNHFYAVAARARSDRWNIRRNDSGRPMLGYIIRTSESYWTLYNAEGRRIGHIRGPEAAEAALNYLYFGDFECVM